MILLLLAMLQGAALPPATSCAALAASDPIAAEQRARSDRSASGRACLGLAFAGQSRFAEAAPAFEEAARLAELGRTGEAARFWAQAGNAWLAGEQPAKARAALDAALAAGTLDGLERGEAALDRARALVATGDTKSARSDLDLAIVDAADDPLAWLLSATLARRTGEMARARTDIAQALRRSPDDAQVQLEVGNIAAASGDEAGATAAWEAAARIAPDRPAGLSAARALTQFANNEKK
ncbi:tetratricopeptide repeat protein [Sphingomonas radiodurans]|uniref:tetratricopeptide repeat protein n=1 Tax=Sphingomonas radiodurans TaxID=2890321 RepID=UPI001E4D9720|nr:tetratricopeptide repeat protein [Sphingomonas radiodurans]WBH18058.1 tetratricopeptide repeat protein [Sphingomonas radiodurans]